MNLRGLRHRLALSHFTHDFVDMRILGPILVVTVTACSPVSDTTSSAPSSNALSRLSSHSTHGMVVTGSPDATAAGVTILEAGGNAIDAAVATALALAVAEPTQSGLGGRTQALVYLADGTAFGFDGTTSVPADYDPDTAEQADDGYAVIGVPGTVAALAAVLQRGGSMAWSDVIAPALALADGGVTLTGGEAGRLASIADRLRESDGARAAFLRSDGTPYAEGDLLRQPALADVLRILGDEGAEAFYRGRIAEVIAQDLEQNGYVDRVDLAAYQPVPSILTRGRIGDLELLGTYLPASGGTTIEALQIAALVGVDTLSSDERAVATALSLLAAFEDRESALADARPGEEDAAWVTSVERARERAAEIRAALGAAVHQTAERPEPHGTATALSSRETSAESPFTTHLSVVDDQGNAVSMTQSLGPSGGSRVATPGLGFLYAATLGGYLGRVEPGDRPWSSQSPLIGLRDGRPVFVIGGAGSRRIISGLVNTLLRVELDGASLAEAMAAPRLHPSSTWTFEQAEGSTGSRPAGAELAEALGHEVVERPFDVWFSRLNAIAIDRTTGAFEGVADPRWRWGSAAGPER